VLLSNENYTIKNEGYDSYANCLPCPRPKDNIVGGSFAQQWRIREIRNRRQFMCVLTQTLFAAKQVLVNLFSICPTDAMMFWSLLDSESETPVSYVTSCPPPKGYVCARPQITFARNPHDLKNQRTFTEVSSRAIIDGAGTSTNTSINISPQTDAVDPSAYIESDTSAGMQHPSAADHAKQRAMEEARRRAKESEREVLEERLAEERRQAERAELETKKREDEAKQKATEEARRKAKETERQALEERLAEERRQAERVELETKKREDEAKQKATEEARRKAKGTEKQALEERLAEGRRQAERAKLETKKKEDEAKQKATEERLAEEKRTAELDTKKMVDDAKQIVTDDRRRETPASNKTALDSRIAYYPRKKVKHIVITMGTSTYLDERPQACHLT
jgi:hypothetical protein